MKKIFLLAVILSNSLLANPQVDQLFQAYDQPGVPGAAVAVMKSGKIIFEKGYGLADLENKIPVTPATNFRLASLTKQYTAMCVMKLLQQGKLTLETSLTDVFPDFPGYGSKITIRHLLNHLGGLKNYEDLIPSTQSEPLKDSDVLEILKGQSTPKFAAGSKYEYSNGGYVLLGLTVEKISGKNFSEFMKETIFTPLGMENSLLFEKADVVPNRAYGYSQSGSGFQKTDQSLTSITRGDGGVYTSVHEWLQWENALNASVLVPSDLQELAFTPGKLNDGTPTSYGFGWMLGTYHGVTHQYHTGSTIGSRTAIERFPDRNLAVIVLINRAESTPIDIARSVADLYWN